MFEVLVIGGGPAGIAAATMLARSGISVAVLERSGYEADGVGETLSPAAASWLAAMGVDLATIPSVASPGICSAWSTQETLHTDFMFSMHGHGWHVDRRAFDAALAARAARSGIAVRTGVRVHSCRRVGTRWSVRTHEGEYEAQWIVDATGRRGMLNHRKNRGDRLVAATAQLTGATHPDRRLVIEAVPDGWWYFAPLPADRAVAVWMTDADLLPPTVKHRDAAWSEGVSRTSIVFSRMRDAAAGPITVRPAGMIAADRVVGDAWIAVGDAAFALDPLSGVGIVHALSSGCRAGRALHAAMAGDLSLIARYERDMAEQWRVSVAQWLARYGEVSRWKYTPFWSRRGGSVSHHQYS